MSLLPGAGWILPVTRFYTGSLWGIYTSAFEGQLVLNVTRCTFNGGVLVDMEHEDGPEALHFEPGENITTIRAAGVRWATVPPRLYN